MAGQINGTRERSEFGALIRQAVDCEPTFKNVTTSTKFADNLQLSKMKMRHWQFPGLI
ncbi:MAG: hypothetical protein WCA13_02300 [Terriglobales bacterium]